MNEDDLDELDDLDERVRASLRRQAHHAPIPADLERDQPTGRSVGRMAVVGAVVAMLVITAASALVIQRRTSQSQSVDPNAGVAGDLGCEGEVIVNPPGREAPVPGVPTAQEAALGWAGPGDFTARVDKEARTAAILRPDGTTLALLQLDWTNAEGVGKSGWAVDGSTYCETSQPILDWDGTGALGCEASDVVRVRIDDTENDRGGTFKPTHIAMGYRTDVTQLIPNGEAGHGDLTATTSNGGRVHTAERLVRIRDRWKTVALAECASQAPGLIPGRPEVAVVPLLAGHCWLDSLTYQGRAWEARAEDDFGSGEIPPGRWHGLGAVVVDGDRLRYRDLGGADIVFLPAGSPGVADKEGCA